MGSETPIRLVKGVESEWGMAYFRGESNSRSEGKRRRVTVWAPRVEYPHPIKEGESRLTRMVIVTRRTDLDVFQAMLRRALARPIKDEQELVEETERNARNAKGDEKRIKHGTPPCVFLFEPLWKAE